MTWFGLFISGLLGGAVIGYCEGRWAKQTVFVMVVLMAFFLLFSSDTIVNSDWLVFLVRFAGFGCGYFPFKDIAEGKG